MRESTERRGFGDVFHAGYPNDLGELRLVGQSSAVGDYHNSWNDPGSSFLWVGKDHHLNREEVAKLRDYLSNWLATGQLFAPGPT